MAKTHSARDRGHIFGEAFMLMRYACEGCGHNEMIWNSRDSVTPFGIGCRKCGEIANHIDWGGDIYAPDYTPSPGTRIFRDGTPDEAERIMRERCDDMRDEYPLPPDEEAALIQRCRDGEEHEFQKGWPRVDEAAN